MAIDYDSHPGDLVNGGRISPAVGVDDLRRAIPSRCFKPSYTKSFTWLLRDVGLATFFMVMAYQHIPGIEHALLRYLAWASYGCLEGLLFTGLWVLAHECGHGGFFPTKLLNESVGFALHTFLMTPYFSWKSTHRRHHIYANNMVMDHNFVPLRRAEYEQSLASKLKKIEDTTEDAPIVTLIRILAQQLLGFPWYLLNNITASPKSLPAPPSKVVFGNSHFAPWGSLFRPEEAHLILASDIGLLVMAYVLHFCASYLGSATTMLLYLQPYLWVNHWIVAITYLHHTHPKLPKFEPEAWTFVKGAVATIDRDFGSLGRFFFHGIIDYHVVHHLFSRIPLYRAEEATHAIVPLLGKSYHADRKSRFLPGLWESFTKCQYVEPDSAADPKSRSLWYKGGRSAPPEVTMARKRWVIWPSLM